MDDFIVSARKYRPATFDTVVGQDHITTTLKNAIRTKTLAQAFLFTGPRGVGKTTCARIFAKTINCLNLDENIEPCNACESCLSFNRSASFNIFELDAASNSSVNDIRNLVDQVRIPPQSVQYKVYIIDEVHMLVGAGAAGSQVDAANILKPALSRGELQVIGATTMDEYRKHIESDAALDRRLQPIMVAEPTIDETIAILRGVRPAYEEHHLPLIHI